MSDQISSVPIAVDRPFTYFLERWRAPALDPHDVDLGREQRELARQKQPPQQTEHDSEEPVELARVPQLMADEVAACALKDRPPHRAHDRPGDEVA